MALLGITTIVSIAAPVRLTLKERKVQYDANNARTDNGYYGFGETW